MILHVVILVVITVGQVLANHCDVTDTLENQWVNVESMNTDSDPRFLSELQVDDIDGCRQACCQKDACSVMIFQTTQNQSSTNCVLLDCSPDQKCVFEDKDDYNSYIIDKKHNTASTTPGLTSVSSSTEKPVGIPSTAASSGSIPSATQNATTTATTTTGASSSLTNLSPAAVLSSVTDAPLSSIATTTTTTTTATTTTIAATTATTMKANTSITTTTAKPVNLTLSVAATNESLTNSTTLGTPRPTTPSMTTTTTTTTTSNIPDSGQNTSVLIVTNQTSIDAEIASSQNDSVSDDVDLESNATTSELLTKDEMGQLLNITQPLSKFTPVENQLPDNLTQPFISILKTSTSRSNSNSLQSSTSSSSSSLSSSSSSITKTPTETTTTTTELHLQNTSTNIFKMSLNQTTDQDFLPEGGSNNVTSGRLDNSEEQTTQNPAIFGGLIALLCFGSFFVLAILAIFGRKLFESWQRRHYSRIDYLVNGMYN